MKLVVYEELTAYDEEQDYAGQYIREGFVEREARPRREGGDRGPRPQRNGDRAPRGDRGPRPQRTFTPRDKNNNED